MTKINFAEHLIANFSDLKKNAVIDPQGSLTYEQLGLCIKQVGQGLLQQGLTAGDRIIICLDDSIDWPCVFLGCIYVGLIPVPLSSMADDLLIDRVLEFVDAKAIVCDRTRLRGSISTKQVHEFYKLEGNISALKQHPDSMAYLSLSSGTTGFSKISVHRHQSFFETLTCVPVHAWNIKKDSVILSTAKMSFAFGLHNSITFAFGLGATAILIKGPPAPSKILHMIETHSVTHLISVPTILNSILKHKADVPMPYSMKTIVSSGEPLPASLEQRFAQSFGVEILNCIGMSEATQTYCSQTSTNKEPGTMGRALPGVICELRDPDGSSTPRGNIGEMWINTAGAALHYWKDWKNTKKTFHGEWLKTNDQMRETDQGNFVYVSRSDDLIKINAMYVSPIEIESSILQIPGVFDCAVVAIPNQQTELLEIKAFVVGEVSKDDLRNNLQGLLPAFMIPRAFEFVDDIPKTLTNKKIRSKLRNQVNIA